MTLPQRDDLDQFTRPVAPRRSVDLPEIEQSLEEVFTRTYHHGQRAEEISRDLARSLARMWDGAAQGRITRLADASEAVEKLMAKLSSEIDELRATLCKDPADRLRDGRYTAELAQAARAAGLSAFEEDGRLLCPPTVIQLLPELAALEIDGEREYRLRPSVVVTALRSAGTHQKPGFKHHEFFNCLLRSYDLIIGRDGNRSGSVVRLIDIWRVLTLFPGREKEYTKAEFARDLRLLDDSGVTSTLHSDRHLRWSASSGTRSYGMLATVGPDGQMRRYWGVSFVPLGTEDDE